MIGLLISVAIFFVFVGLYVHHSRFEPYGWAQPGVESVMSRNLWLARRELYGKAIVFSTPAVALFGAVLLLSGRRGPALR